MQQYVQLKKNTGMVVTNLIFMRESIDYKGIGVLVNRVVHTRTSGSQDLSVFIVFMALREESIVPELPYEEYHFLLQGGGRNDVCPKIIETPTLFVGLCSFQSSRWVGNHRQRAPAHPLYADDPSQDMMMSSGK